MLKQSAMYPMIGILLAYTFGMPHMNTKSFEFFGEVKKHPPDRVLSSDHGQAEINCEADSAEEKYHGKIPAIPHAQFDFSYFESASYAESDAFRQAKEQIEIYTERINELVYFPEKDLREEIVESLQENKQDCVYEDGLLKWELYTENSSGNDVKFLLQADPDSTSDVVEWELYLTDSYNFDSDLIFKAVTDFSAREWSDVAVYGYGEDGSLSEKPLLKYSQQVDKNGTIIGGEYKLENPYGESAAVVTYSTDSSEYRYKVENPEMQLDIEIYWNRGTGEGYLERYGNRRCWNDRFEEVRCE